MILTPQPSRACRACGGSLDTLLHLGHLVPPAYLAEGEPDAQPLPLDWCACTACHLVQLRHSVDLRGVCAHYDYRSGVNDTMVNELQDVATQAAAWVGMQAHDIVVDIGANDGTLLAAYATGITVAIEPAGNFRDTLTPRARIVISDFFPAATQHWAPARVKILTSVATFYATEDPHAYLAEIARLLHPDGIWIVQFQDLWQMVQQTAFDNITWEHQFYPCLADIETWVAAHGLRVITAQRRAINGGSYRLVVQQAHHPARPSVAALLAAEAGCQDWDTLDSFAWRVGEARRQITGLVDHLQRAGQVIDLYAASTKSATLLQYCDLDARVLRQCWERSPEKVGRRTAGTHIPIVSEAAGRADPPDALLVGAWQFRDSFLHREAAYLEAGGQMIFPLPACDIVRGTP